MQMYNLCIIYKNENYYNMAFDNRKKKIMEHLQRSAGGVDYSVKKSQDRRSMSDSLPTPTPASNLTPAPIETMSSTPTPVNKQAAAASTPSFSIASRSGIGAKATYSSGGSRKRIIMQHVKTTAAGINDFSLEPKDRKRKIQEHLRQSRG